MTPDLPAHSEEHEALLQFLYLAPVGLVKAGLDGLIDMINPVSAQLLMPLAPDGNLSNLFTVLERVAPGLRQQCASFAPQYGVICDAMRVPLGDLGGGAGAPQVLSLTLLKLDQVRLMAVIGDATQEIQREQDTLTHRLDNAARTDALTRLPNRGAVREQLQLVLQRSPAASAGNFALLFMNCDRFKQINDSFGQAAGDQLLVTIAERLRAALRPPSDELDLANGAGQLAARIGGDEFVVVLDGMRRLGDVEGIAARLLSALGKPYRVQGHDVICKVSMGVLWGAGSLGDADQLMRDASIAMVEAKRQGGGRHMVFESAMLERAAHRRDVEAELRQALGNDELFVVYQPVVGLDGSGATDRSAGVEALVRWQHPLRGRVPPVEFIPVAEESDLICAVGDFVLERACRDFMRWQADLGALAPRLLAVNLSRAQLGQLDWVGRVAEILRTSGMRAEQLQLEVTESLAAQDQHIQTRLHELKQLGVKLALDDFGTGYSSLASLHLLPVDTVKIDRSFVSQADTSQHHRVLIEATVKVAQSLGMGTVAEGIETEAQAAVVRQLMCAKGQGYLYSRPLTAEALAAWLTAAT